jgi:lysophospholipase L1-like esterase
MQERDIRICFVGDSFVNGTGDEKALGWAGRLCASANTKKNCITYYNLGIRRNTSRDVLLRFARECAPRLPKSADGRVVLSFGVNDTLMENGNLRVSFEQSCANLREVLRRAGQYKTILVGPPPVCDHDHNDRISALSQAYAREARILGVPFIELFAHLVADSRYRGEVTRNDGGHPTGRGYAKIAALIGSSRAWWFKGKLL